MIDHTTEASCPKCHSLLTKGVCSACAGAGVSTLPPGSPPSSGERSIDELLLDLSDDTKFDESTFNQVITPRTPPRELEEVSAGDFVIQELEHQDLTGCTFTGVRSNNQAKMLIKVLAHALSSEEELLQRFLSESTPHVADIVFSGTVLDDAQYFVLEHPLGHRMDQYLEQHLPLEPAAIHQLFSQLCDTLEAAHNMGLVHSNLNPREIFLEETPQGDLHLRLICCGKGKGKGAASPDSGLDLGQPHHLAAAYLAPEQHKDDPVDARADIFALGVMLYHIFTETLPFDGELPPQTPPTPPSELAELSPELERLILDCLSLERDVRPASVAELKGALLPLLGAPREASREIEAALALLSDSAAGDPEPPPIQVEDHDVIEEQEVGDQDPLEQELSLETASEDQDQAMASTQPLHDKDQAMASTQPLRVFKQPSGEASVEDPDEKSEDQVEAAKGAASALDANTEQSSFGENETPTSKFIALKALVENRPTEEMSPIQVISQSTIGSEDPTPIQLALPDAVPGPLEAEEQSRVAEAGAEAEIAVEAEAETVAEAEGEAEAAAEAEGEAGAEAGAELAVEAEAKGEAGAELAVEAETEAGAMAEAVHEQPEDLAEAAMDLQELSSRSKAVFIAGGALLAGGAILALILI